MTIDPFAMHSRTPPSCRLTSERPAAGCLPGVPPAGEQHILTLAPERSAVSIGRLEGCDVRFEADTGVSRLHAQLERLGPGWVIVDGGVSTNGTHVDAKRVPGSTKLRHGNVIRVGTSLILYHDGGEPRSFAATTNVVDSAAAVVIGPTHRPVLVALCRPFRYGDPHAEPPTNADIAREVNVTVYRVKGILQELFKIVDVGATTRNKRLRLVHLALERGLVLPEEL